MVEERTQARGGFRRPIKFGPFIRDFLSVNPETWAYEVYRAYKEALEAIPLSRKRGKRRAPSILSFLKYLWILRQLGLIEYVTTPEGEIKEERSMDHAEQETEWTKKNPLLIFRAVPGELGNPAWEYPWQAYLGYSPPRGKKKGGNSIADLSRRSLGEAGLRIAD